MCVRVCQYVYYLEKLDRNLQYQVEKDKMRASYFGTTILRAALSYFCFKLMILIFVSLVGFFRFLPRWYKEAELPRRAQP